MNKEERTTTDSTHTPDDISFEVFSDEASQLERVSDLTYNNYYEQGYLGIVRIKFMKKKITAPFRSFDELRTILKQLQEVKWEGFREEPLQR